MGKQEWEENDEELDIHNEPANALQLLIDSVADEELKAALSIIGKRLIDPAHDRNQVSWSIQNTNNEDFCAGLFLGISVW